MMIRSICARLGGVIAKNKSNTGITKRALIAPELTSGFGGVSGAVSGGAAGGGIAGASTHVGMTANVLEKTRRHEQEFSNRSQQL